MSFHERQLESLGQRIRTLHARERDPATTPLLRLRLQAERWVLMVYHEFQRDEVGVRAESLSYLMLFSLLPLLAGMFFIFSIFAQFGFVAEALGGFVNGFLETIPAEHRGFVTDYVVQFKEAYLKNLSSKSGNLGIFAIAILLWIGLSAFLNVDRTINLIWGSESRRPWLEQVRNFLFVAIAAPLVLIASLSVPFVLRTIPATAQVLDYVPGANALLNWAVPIAIIFFTFFCLYRYVPVRRVQARAALGGALFTALLLHLVNAGMNLYFRIGTQTAYGKAAVVPLVAFWIYISWIVIILGAEISFLLQQGEELIEAPVDSPTLREAHGLIQVLATLREAFMNGSNPVSFERLRDASGVDSRGLHRMLRFLCERGLVAEARNTDKTFEGDYILAMDLGRVPVAATLRAYLGLDQPSGRAETPWSQSLDHWMGYFGTKSFAEVPLEPISAKG